MHGDAVNELIRQSYTDAVSKENLRPAGGPRIEPIQVEPGSDLKFAAVFEVLPEVTRQAGGRSSQIERPVADITEADVDAMLESMRRQRVKYQPVERASVKGDRVTVDFLGRLDGVAFAGGEGKDMPVVIGSGRAIADFEAALIGHERGRNEDRAGEVPGQLRRKDLAGKTTEFDLTVKSVEEEFLPPVDDAFAEAFGLTEGGVAALRDEVRRSMEREAAEAVRARLRAQVFEALQRDNPRASCRVRWWTSRSSSCRSNCCSAWAAQDASQMPPREPFEEPARRRVTLGLLIGELVRREGLKVDRERVFARLDELAAAYPNPDEVRRGLPAEPGHACARSKPRCSRTRSWTGCVARAHVTDRPTSFAELTGFGRQA